MGGYNPMSLKTVTPDGQGITNQIGGPGTTKAGPITVYDSPNQVNGNFLVIDHRGYFIPPSTGTYNFTSPYSNDFSTIWLGPEAYSGWDLSNTSIDQEASFFGKSIMRELKQGVPLAYRGFYYNTYAAGFFALQITGPDGMVVEYTTTTDSPYMVQYLCDGSAPAFPPWEQET